MQHTSKAQASGRRLALCRLPGAREYKLGGCVNDTRSWKRARAGLGFETRLLLDREASRATLELVLHRLVASSRAGDVTVFQYDSHGTHTPDLNSDEDDDTDEALCPVDFASGALSIDDNIAQVFSRFRDGVSNKDFLRRVLGEFGIEPQRDPMPDFAARACAHPFLDDGQFGVRYRVADLADRRVLIDPLRSAVEQNTGNPRPYQSGLESHQLGSVLVSAVFDAFVQVYRRRTERFVATSHQCKRTAAAGQALVRPAGVSPGQCMCAGLQGLRQHGTNAQCAFPPTLILSLQAV